MCVVRKRYVFVAVVCLLLIPACPGMARMMRMWSDSDLWKEADLVVIATAVSTQAPKPFPALKPSDQTMVETTFTAHHVLKGSLSPKTFRLSHLAYSDPGYQPTMMINGWPGAINFDEKTRRQYLLFLKHETGSVYSPLSGQRDPDFSIRILVPYRLGPGGPL